MKRLPRDEQYMKTPLYFSPDVGDLRSERLRISKVCRIQEKQKQGKKPSPHIATTKTELNIKYHKKN